MKNEYFIGALSGTSMDAIDTVLVEFDDSLGVSVIETFSESLPKELKKNLIKLQSHDLGTLKLFGESDSALGHLFAACIKKLLKKANIPLTSIRAIGSHGQTILHIPFGKYPFTLQIGDPNIIVTQTGITTITDFRRRDLALGGQAAPLAPAFHNFLLRSNNENRFVLNIGGIANITFLSQTPKEPIIGFDTGPGNTLLDNWCSKHRRKPYDHHGEWAASGKIQTKLLANLLADPYFKRVPPKSTGPEYFNLDWLTKKIQGEIFKPEDIQATLVELTAQSVANACQNFPNHAGSLWLCGGGVQNHYLVERLTELCKPLRVTTTEEIGIHPNWIEAVCFAWLAKQTLEGKAGNIPSVTGARKATLLGGIYNKN